MSKLMCVEVKCVRFGKEKGAVSIDTREVTIEKETPKQYTISGGFYRSKLNKSDLLSDLGYNYSQVFYLEEDESKALSVVRKRLEREIESYERKLNERKSALAELEKLEA